MTVSLSFLLALAQDLKSQRKYFIITMSRKDGGFEVRLLGLNLEFLTVLLWAGGFTFSALVSSSAAGAVSPYFP